jgi:CrcB protein
MASASNNDGGLLHASQRADPMLVAIALGGALGAVTRYLVAVRVYTLLGVDLPYGTLTVNVIGSFVLGIVMALVEERGLFGPEVRAFLTIGFLGGMTTFSTFSFESWAMLRDGETLRASLNVTLSVAGAFAAVAAGHSLVRLLER